MSETTNDTPSALAEWLTAYRTKGAAVAEAIDGLTRHLAHLPDPRSAEDTRALLHFRQQRFGLSAEPANWTARRHAAGNTADQLIDDAKRRVQEALAALLDNFEQLLAHDARHHRHGLFAPDALPREAIHIDGKDNVHLVNRAALPNGHPLHDVAPVPRFPWLFLCPSSTGYRMNGSPVQRMPEWATVASVRQKAEEQHAASAEQERIEREQRQREEQQEQAEQRRLTRELSDPLHERARLEQLEKSLEGKEIVLPFA